MKDKENPEKIDNFLSVYSSQSVCKNSAYEVNNKHKLCIFDYHGTLIWAIDVHDNAFSKTVKDIYGVEGSIHDVYFAASTIQDVTIGIAKNKGVSEKDAEDKRGLILPIYEKHFEQALKQNEIMILPGVHELLNSVKKEGIPIALYTGDSFGSINCIFKKSGLDEYFPDDMRSCASNEVSDRTELLKLVIKKAEKKYKKEFSENNIFVFDDSIKGLESGKALGIVTIGVATGTTKYKNLQTISPDYLFENFKDYKKVLGILLK